MVRRRQTRISTSTAASAINPTVLRAVSVMSKKLRDSGYPHMLIGGLAVRHHGYERTTSDVDFLVSSEAAQHLTGDSLGGVVHGKSLRTADHVVVDFIFPSGEEQFLESEIRRAYRNSAGRTPVISREALIYMKLAAGRMKDQADVTELIKRGKIDLKKTSAYLRKHRPDLVEELESMVSMAKLEDD